LEEEQVRELIEALMIFSKYMPDSAYSPTHCEHDVLYVMVQPEKVTEEDKARLEKYGFSPDEDLDNFYSYRYGSA
jgi:hypothetical protein